MSDAFEKMTKTSPRRPRAAAAFLLLALAGVAAPRAEAQTGGEKLAAVVFMHADAGAGGAEEGAPYRELLYGALEAKMTAEGFRVLPRAELLKNPAYAALADRGEVSGAAVLAAARELEADTAAAGVYGIEGRRLFIQIKVYDVRTGKLVAAAMEYGLAGLSGYNLVGEMADGISPEIRAYREGFDPEEPLTYEAVESLVLRSPDEGMEVAFESGAPFGRIADGTLRPPYVPFRVGTSIQVLKSKPGYHEAVEKITVGEGVNDVTLRPLDRKFRNETSLYWTNGQALGAGAGYRYYPNPDFFFVGADYQFYVQHDFAEGSSPVLHNEFSFAAGGYLFSSYRSRVRLGYSAGLGVVVTSFTAPDLPVYTDYYVNYATVFIDVNFRPWTFFVYAYGKYSLGWGNEILGTGHMSDNIGPPVGLGVRKKW